jgi:hypothetical protein
MENFHRESHPEMEHSGQTGKLAFLLSVALCRQTQDVVGRACRSESIVDVHDGDSAAAAIQHPKKRTKPREACPVADARRDGNDRLVDEPGHHPGKGSLHARRNDQHSARPDPARLSKQPVKAGYSNVNNPLDAPAKAFESDGSLLRNRQVRCPRTDDSHAPGSRRSQGLTNRNAPSTLVKNRFRQTAADCLKVCGFSTRREHELIALAQRDRDSADLGRQLALAKDHFRPAAAPDPIEVDPRKAQIMRRLAIHSHENTSALESYCFL